MCQKTAEEACSHAFGKTGKKKAVLFSESEKNLNRVYSEEVRKKLAEKLDLSVICGKDALLHFPEKDKICYLFSTWGMPAFTEAEIYTFPALECVFYAAGSVQGFARTFLTCGVRVFSAWAANAVPVAEYAAAQIILANKGFFGSSVRFKAGDYDAARAHHTAFRGNYGQKVGLLGAGMIGKLVIEKLRAYRLDVCVFDPFLPDETAQALKVRKVSLPEIFRECGVVSNHLANNAQTVGMLDYSLFSLMPENGVFLNTGRGAQVVEEDLCRALREKPGRFAVLDVTTTEPPEPGHPFYQLDNVLLTPHIAGSSGDETHRMAEYMLDEFLRLEAQEPLHYEVTEAMLKTMA